MKPRSVVEAYSAIDGTTERSQVTLNSVHIKPLVDSPHGRQLSGPQGEMRSFDQPCAATLDSDCEADSVVPGQRLSSRCCELDCAHSEEIVESTSDESPQFRCVTCPG